MASQKITDFSEQTTNEDNALIPIVVAGENKKITLANLLQKTIRVDKAAEINSVASKGTVSDADIIMLEDSEASNVKKKVTVSAIRSGLCRFYASSSDPTLAPPEVGSFFFNTTSNRFYISVGTSSSDDWIQLQTA